jgi:hypothetical protein
VRSEEILRRLLSASVRVQGARVGHVSGVLLDAAETHVLGLEVTSEDRVRRFLPWVAAHFANGAIDTDSALMLVDSADTYVERGALVKRDPEELGQLVADARGFVAGAEAPTNTYPRSA